MFIKGSLQVDEMSIKEDKQFSKKGEGDSK